MEDREKFVWLENATKNYVTDLSFLSLFHGWDIVWNKKCGLGDCVLKRDSINGNGRGPVFSERNSFQSEYILQQKTVHFFCEEGGKR